jgi:flagellar basal-body rod protein FlgB
MQINSSSNTTLALMERYLDMSARRQVLIAENLAQIDTPGYRAKDIPFEEHMSELVRQADRADAGALANSPMLSRMPAAEEVRGLELRPDQNNVNMDREMTALAANTAKFGVVSQLLVQKMRILRSSIQEGR